MRRYGRSCRIKFLWRELGEEVGVSRGAGKKAIVRRIYEHLQGQHLILIFNDACLTEKGYLSQLIQEFWHPLLDELAHIQPVQATRHQLIMFVIDYQAQADLQGVDWTDKFDHHSRSYRPVKLELSAFCKTDVKGWFEHHAHHVLPSQLTGYFSNQARIWSILVISWLGRLAILCGASGTSTSKVPNWPLSPSSS